MKQPEDEEQRRLIQTEFGKTYFVEAAAGAGKTTALVSRIVAMIMFGHGTLAKTVAVTFTEKAAGEMKLRLRLEIEKARTHADGDERRRLDVALEELELARIGTIHSFCGDLLRERPVEAGIDPVFRTLPEDEAGAIMDMAFDRWLQRSLTDPPEGLRRMLHRRSQRGQSAQEQLRVALRSLCEHRDFPHPWRRDPFDREAVTDELVEELMQLGGLASEASQPKAPLSKALDEIERRMLEATRLERVGNRDYDAMEAALRELHRFNGWKHKSWQGNTFGLLTDIEVMSRRDRAKANLDAFVAASDADLAPLLHHELQAAVAEYQRLKAEAGTLDFLDLLIKARDLVRDDAEVRADLQQRFERFYVDEFQDTDPLQAEILLLLAADDPSASDWRTARPVPGKLFLVGDPKQSIYAFRRADVALYEGIKNRLRALGAEPLYLKTSFRSPPSIQKLVNAAFAPAFALDAEASGYVALGEARDEIDGRPTVVALPVPDPYSSFGSITGRSIEDSTPVAVAAYIEWLVNESGWTIEEAGRQVPIKPRHVALLFRRLRNFGADVTRPYLRELEARRIPHVLVGGRSFHDREEVIALRTALAAVEWPDDELRVFATLRGPFFAIGDEALLVFRQQVNADGKTTRRSLDPMRRIERETLDPVALEVADALEILRQLHLGRNSRPIAQTVSTLLESVRAHAGIALWQNGEQALANCQRLVDQARHFESRASSFRAFVERIEADAEGGEVDDAPIIEEGTEGVRAMTVFKAKGLDFPVVIPVDPTCKAIRETADRHVDPTRSLWLERLCGTAPIELQEANALELERNRAEGVRVAYVAATRARDLLVIPTCGDQKLEGWLDALNPALYPDDAMRRYSQVPAGCPPFGEESIRSRPKRAKAPAGGSVRPGQHRPIPHGPDVVWWDPTVLKLDVEELAVLRHQRLLERSESDDAAIEGRAAYAAWKRQRETTIGKASEAAYNVQTVTAWSRLSGVQPATFGSVSTQKTESTIRTGGGGGGRRFGSLVHAILAMVPLDAEAAQIEQLAAVQAKLVDASVDELLDATATVTRALRHPIMRRAASLPDSKVHREIPVSLRLEDCSLLEGVADLAFEETSAEFSGWTVVDFKTTREYEGEGSPAEHIRQVGAYCRAIEAATGAATRGFVLVI
jgi:ATP-dependent exoDNAse (exonuclease V) beta subunit